MKAQIIQFRRARHHYTKRHFIIAIDAKNKEEVRKFIGREVLWKSPAGKIIKGKIASSHGNKGLVRAIFETGLPGQAVASYVEVK